VSRFAAQTAGSGGITGVASLLTAGIRSIGWGPRGWNIGHRRSLSLPTGIRDSSSWPAAPRVCATEVGLSRASRPALGSAPVRSVSTNSMSGFGSSIPIESLPRHWHTLARRRVTSSGELRSSQPLEAKPAVAVRAPPYRPGTSRSRREVHRLCWSEQGHSSHAVARVRVRGWTLRANPSSTSPPAGFPPS
jgi:hypothetical protein